MVMPGDTITFKVKLIAPIALEEKQRFAIREGGKDCWCRCCNKDRCLITNLLNFMVLKQQQKRKQKRNQRFRRLFLEMELVSHFLYSSKSIRVQDS